MKSRSEKIAYIDLYSGPGIYGDGTESTPIKIAKHVIESPTLRSRTVMLFNDKSQKNIQTLQKSVDAIPNSASLSYQPTYKNEEVDENFSAYFQSIRLVPAIAFIDPFGIKGLTLSLLRSLVKDWGCECIFFFNYNRINMWASNPVMHEHIAQLFGIADLVIRLRDKTPDQRESIILESVFDSIGRLVVGNEVNILPFKFKSETKNRTSHYVVHLTKNILGYKIMKEIMVNCIRNSEGDIFFDELLSVGGPYKEYSLTIDMLPGHLMRRFCGQKISVRQIVDSDFKGKPFIEKDYKEAIKSLKSHVHFSRAKNKPLREGTMPEDVMVAFPKQIPLEFCS